MTQTGRKNPKLINFGKCLRVMSSSFHQRVICKEFLMDIKWRTFGEVRKRRTQDNLKYGPNCDILPLKPSISTVKRILSSFLVNYLSQNKQRLRGEKVQNVSIDNQRLLSLTQFQQYQIGWGYLCRNANIVKITFLKLKILIMEKSENPSNFEYLKVNVSVL